MEGHVRNHGGPPGQLHEQELRHLQQEESQAPQQLSDVSDLPQDTLSEQSFRQELLAQQEATQDDPVIDPAIAQGGGCSVVGADGGPQILREGKNIPQGGACHEPRAVGVNSAAAADFFPTQPEIPSTHTPLRSAPVVTPSRKLAQQRVQARLLSRLLAASDDFFDHLSLRGFSSDEEDFELTTYRALFEQHRSSYVRDASDLVIRLEDVELSVGVAHGSPTWLEVCRIVSAANLTTLTDELVLVSDSIDDRLNLLRTWEFVFPHCLLPPAVVSYDELGMEDVAEQVLDLRTQLLLLTLRKLQDSGSRELRPLEQVSNVFLPDGSLVSDFQGLLAHDDGSLRFRHTVGLDFDGAGWLRDLYVTRLRAIGNGIPDAAIPFDIRSLEEHFPFDGFRDSLLGFAALCYAKNRAAQQPQEAQYPASHSMEMPYPELPYAAASRDRHETPSQADSAGARSQFEAEASQCRATNALVDDVQALKQLHEQQEQERTRLPSAPRRLSPTEDPCSVHVDGIIGRSQDIHSPQYAPTHPYFPVQTGMLYTQSAAYLHPSHPHHSSSSGQTPGPKRAAVGMEASGGLETDDRPAKRRRAPSRRNARGGHLASEIAASIGSSASMSALFTSALGTSVHPEVPGSTLGAPDLEALEKRSREIAAAHRKPREVQIRKPWSRNDVRKLIMMVDLFKCKWSSMQKEIASGFIKFDRTRDQQALRDKARILKQEFLKTDALLPPSFDLVVLGKKERRAVIQCGKNPDRKERDVADGCPVNTIYRPEPEAGSAEPSDPHGEVVASIPASAAAAAMGTSSASTPVETPPPTASEVFVDPHEAPIAALTAAAAQANAEERAAEQVTASFAEKAAEPDAEPDTERASAQIEEEHVVQQAGQQTALALA